MSCFTWRWGAFGIKASFQQVPTILTYILSSPTTPAARQEIKAIGSMAEIGIVVILITGTSMVPTTNQLIIKPQHTRKKLYQKPEITASYRITIFFRFWSIIRTRITITVVTIPRILRRPLW